MNYRLTINPALEKGNNTISKTYPTKVEMEAAKDFCADLLLFIQDDLDVMKDYSNVFICEQSIGGEWYDMDDEIEGEELEDWGDNSESETGYSGECS